MQVFYSIRDFPKEHLFRRRSVRLKGRIIALLQEKHRLEDELDLASRHPEKYSGSTQTVEQKLANIETREDRLFRELERLTLLTERADSIMWRWLMFVFALTNFVITLINFHKL